ncbi:MAG TPA: SprT family zinc-dependent metalloprotease [Bosea sp. (in: a-proteobacteria)]|jgi:hypothetical protein|uniref:M48 family metallopeptidase n=1 Tax=Bosea sp. (in: a-proteobacteria) TaxID=1871050 RepID=UPI002E11FC31|nr:SprT family zinc-dependent metalloprotease [Bosea sp. (in: a-proteobacteria)]
MPVLAVGDTEISYTLRRSATARQARITVSPSSVVLVVPQAATDEQIAGVLHRRRAWLVSETLRMSAKVLSTPAIAHFTTGAKIPYRGRMAKLRLEPTGGTLVEVAFRNGFIVSVPRSINPKSADSLIETALRLWLKKRLRVDVAAFVAQHGAPNGLKPKDVRIKEQRHLWGSCGQDRIVNLNWQLVFAPKTVLEYAVVHELCHLRHRNHDPEFWGLVATIIPDWQDRKGWLDRNEHLLGWQKVGAIIGRKIPENEDR